MGVMYGLQDNSFQHFSSFHSSLNMRTAIPKPILAIYPALYSQNLLDESITILDVRPGAVSKTIDVGYPPKYEALERRENLCTTVKEIQLPELGPMSIS